MTRLSVVGLLTLISIPAMAQSASKVQTACMAHLLPAYQKPSADAKNGLDVDCGCITGYLTKRFGAGDAEVIVRIFAAASSESKEAMDAVARDLGTDRIRAAFGKVGKFEVLGREMNAACPETKRP